MFVSDRIIFLELHKTGCSHIGMLLQSLLGGYRIGKHNRITPQLLDRGVTVLGSIRDPWEWYVSLWAYGCEGKGALHDSVTRRAADHRQLCTGSPHYPPYPLRYLDPARSRRRQAWQRVYADSRDASAFREWLHMMYDETCWRDIGKRYHLSPIRRYAGFYTHRYLELSCGVEGAPPPWTEVSSFDDLVRLERERCLVDRFIRNERLEDDLIGALESAGIPLTDDNRATIRGAGRTNASSRGKEVSRYYDPATEELVRRGEALLIDKFGYLSPGSDIRPESRP